MSKRVLKISAILSKAREKTSDKSMDFIAESEKIITDYSKVSNDQNIHPSSNKNVENSSENLAKKNSSVGGVSSSFLNDQNQVQIKSESVCSSKEISRQNTSNITNVNAVIFDDIITDTISLPDLEIGQNKTSEPKKNDKPTQSRHNTDTPNNCNEFLFEESINLVPTQYRHNYDSQQKIITDTIPTQTSDSNLNYVSNSKVVTDTVPAQNENNNDFLTDTIPTQQNNKPKLKPRNSKRPNTDTVPAQDRLNTDTIPTHNRHSTDTIPAHQRSVPTQVPTHNQTYSSVNTDTNSRPFTHVEKIFWQLRGKQRLLMDFIIQNSILNKAQILKSTYEDLAEIAQIPHGSIRTTLKRLRNENLISINAPVKGPGAFIEIKLEENIVGIAAKYTLEKTSHKEKIPTQTSAQPLKNTDTNTDTMPSSMYVGNLNKNTIHTEQSKQPIDTSIDSWLDLHDVDYSLLAPWNIRSNVIETFKKNKWEISRIQLEEFIERFTRYFSEKEFEKRREPIKSPYSFFLSSIKAISKGEPDPICDIKTQFQLAQELALQNKMKELERRRRDYETIEKQMEQYLESEYNHWSNQLSNEEKTSIAPTNNIAKLGSVAHNLILKNHFVHNIWPEIKNGLLKSSTSENFNQSTEMSQ